MKVLNIHEREFDVNSVQVGALIDSLASENDRLWPVLTWPRMAFDRALCIGAKGGHGPIRYIVEEYRPSRLIKFRFTGPAGFNGFHGYEILSGSNKSTLLRHTLKMNTHGFALVSWPLVYRPMHDALIEDSLATAEASLGLTPTVRIWSLWIKFLRWVISGGKARSQIIPHAVSEH